MPIRTCGAVPTTNLPGARIRTVLSAPTTGKVGRRVEASLSVATTGASSTLTASDGAEIIFAHGGYVVGRSGGAQTLEGVHLHLSRVPSIVEAGGTANRCSATTEPGAPLPAGTYQIVAVLRVISGNGVYVIASAPARFVLS